MAEKAGGRMRKPIPLPGHRPVVWLLLLLVWSASCSRQPKFGPKDGAGLPPRELDRIRVNEPAPDFTLLDKDHRAFTLSDFRDQKYVVLVFYRGHW
jgi:hypothetical protein